MFIGEVKKRKALWDQSSRHYHNKKALSDGWRDIAKIFNVEGKGRRRAKRRRANGGGVSG